MSAAGVDAKWQRLGGCLVLAGIGVAGSTCYVGAGEVRVDMDTTNQLPAKHTHPAAHQEKRHLCGIGSTLCGTRVDLAGVSLRKFPNRKSCGWNDVQMGV